MRVWLKSLALYTSGVALCLLLLFFTLRLWQADLHVPFQYYGDSVWGLAWVKGLLEDGWYLHSERLGAPGTMDVHDFPLADSLFFLMLKLLVRATRDVALAYNLFFLLSFPLTTLTSLFTLRRLQISAGPALVASLLYAFQPYHFLRGEGHVFLASYFLVPLAILLLLRLYLGQPGNRLGTAVVCLLLGCAGVYYAFFTCFFLLVAGAVSAARHRKLALLSAAGLMCALIALAVGANLLPTWLYQREHGPNPAAVVRTPAVINVSSLKVAQILLPVDGHRVTWLAHFKDSYNKDCTPSWSESSYGSLGLAATTGFLLLLGRLLLRKPFTRPCLADGLATLNAAALMLACVGGAGSLFALCVTPWISSYSRVSIFISFFSLVALTRLFNRLGRHPRSPAVRWCYHGGLAAVLVVGILDQCPASFVPPYPLLKLIYTSEAAFVARIEQGMPSGSMIFQLPSLPFPEAPPTLYFAATDHFRGYLHSHTLRWSYGAIKGREVDRWRERVAGQPVPEMVEALVRAGFRGIWLDRWGYVDGGASVERQLSDLLDASPLVSGHDRFSFFDLTGYAGRLQQGTAPMHPGRLAALPGQGNTR